VRAAETDPSRQAGARRIRSVRNLRHEAVNAIDGRIGFVEQVFFDDDRWTIRYLVVDTDKEFDYRRVLVSPLAVIAHDAGTPGMIRVRLSRRQVAESPDIDTEKPVSRQKELEYNKYFLFPSYWNGIGVWGSGLLPAELLGLAAEISSGEQAPADVHLRSSREVIGYRVKANDGKVGHVEDFLYDDATWQFRYLEVDIRNWIGGAHVLVPSSWVQWVSWEERSIQLDLTVEAVRAAPEYDSVESLTPEFEQRLRSHYRPTE
jgi:hypothetical protein